MKPFKKAQDFVDYVENVKFPTDTDSLVGALLIHQKVVEIKARLAESIELFKVSTIDERILMTEAILKLEANSKNWMEELHKKVKNEDIRHGAPDSDKRARMVFYSSR